MVRPFPRTPRFRPRTRAAAACAALLTAGSPLVVPRAYGDDLHDRKHKVHQRVGHALGDLDESSRELAAATRKLQRSRAALAAAQRRLGRAERRLTDAEAYDAKMQARLAEAEHQLALAREELAAARAAVKESRRRIGELAASNYAHGDPALMGLAVMLNSQNPAEATSQLNTVDALMSREDTELDDLREARAEQVEKEAAVADKAAEVAEERKAAAERVVTMQQLRREALTARQGVAALVAHNRAVEAEAERIRRADVRKLEELRRQEARIQRIIEARARAAARRAAAAARRAAARRAAASRPSSGSRVDPGGVLLPPVSGPVTSPYGWRIHPIYGYWGLHDGTDFRAPCGTPMRASASGTVIARYWSDVYGNRLYVDVGQFGGHNLTLVYNHASSYRVGVGNHVSRGETVGWSGDTGWSTACHLHFTVLRDGTATNPMNYM